MTAQQKTTFSCPPRSAPTSAFQSKRIRSHAWDHHVMTVCDYSNRTANIIGFDNDSANQDYQIWSSQDAEDGAYCIVAKATPKMAMDLEGRKIGPGVKIINNSSVPNDDYQEWHILHRGDNLVTISPKLDNSYAMTLKNGSNHPGTEVILTKINNNLPTGDQLWKFTDQ